MPGPGNLWDKDQAGMQVRGTERAMADLPTGRTWPDPVGSREQRVQGQSRVKQAGRWEVGWQTRGCGRLSAGLGFREEGSLREAGGHACDSEADNACRLCPSSRLDQVSGDRRESRDAPTVVSAGQGVWGQGKGRFA